MNRSLIEKVPDFLTTVRIIGTVPVLLLLCLIGFSPTIHLVTSLLVVALALTDCVDGRWARHFGCVSDFGRHFDPLADKWLTALYVPIVSWGMIHFIPVTLLLVRDITITDLRARAAKQGKLIPAHLSGKIKTAISFPLLCLLIAFVPVEGSYFSAFHWLSPYLYWIGGLLLSIVSLWSGIDYYSKFRKGVG